MQWKWIIKTQKQFIIKCTFSQKNFKYKLPFKGWCLYVFYVFKDASHAQKGGKGLIKKYRQNSDIMKYYYNLK